MRHYIASAVAAVSIMSATAVLAANTSATGVIKSVNAKGDSITLSDGKSYTLSEGVEAETLKAGEKVSIVFHIKNGKMIATAVKVLK